MGLHAPAAGSQPAARPNVIDDFGRFVAKFVRDDHVQTDDHWLSKPVVKNGLFQAMEKR